MIIGCIIYYNEVDFIKDCVDSIIDHVDKIIAVDGRIQDFPDVPILSNDGTNEILSQYFPKLTTISINQVWPSEVAKRNAYLVGSKGDWYFVIDADEVLVNGDTLEDGIDNLRLSGADFGQIKVVGYGADRLAGRLIKHQNGLNYFKKHHRMRKQDTIIWEGDSGPEIEHCYLKHRKDERSQERLRQKAKLGVREAIREN